MELFYFLLRFKFHLVMRGQDFVRDWAPSISLDPSVPAIMIVILRLVILDVYLLLPHILLDLVVVTRSESIDINYRPMGEDLVVDQGWESLTSQSEPNMAL